MKKNLVIFFPTNKTITQAYEFLRPEIEKREMQMLSCFPQEHTNIFMVRHIENFFWENAYIPNFWLEGDTWKIYSWEKIHADLVLWFKMPDNTTNRYPCDMRDITIDKSILETIFPEHTIKSISCESYEEVMKNFSKIQTNKKVLKPISESGWKWIIVWEEIPEEDVLSSEYYPYLLQEFHDTSWGFYKVCKWTHDFRVVILNGEIIWKILRQPKKWSFVCNTRSGWSLQDIFDFTIPEKIMKVIKDIDDYCSQYTHRYYSIDMWIGIDGSVKVYELNSAAALSNKHIAHKLWNYIAKNILKVS